MNNHKSLALVLSLLTITTQMSAGSSANPTAMVAYVDAQKGVFELPSLPYSYEALAPYIDARTLEIHHNRHHKTYVDNLNKAIEGTPFATMTLLELFAKSSSLPTKIKNNAGGHFGHTFYWACMAAVADKDKHTMSQRLEKALVDNFGSIDSFKEKFRNAGLDCFGSGYTWLVEKNGKLFIGITANQDNPLMESSSFQGRPILVCDVWEHAYYLAYQNMRGDYLNSFWNLVNWEYVDNTLFNKS